MVASILPMGTSFPFLNDMVAYLKVENSVDYFTEWFQSLFVLLASCCTAGRCLAWFSANKKYKMFATFYMWTFLKCSFFKYIYVYILSSSSVEALYQSTYPEYLQYIYLVAPVSLMLLNPIGFAFCEIQKWKDQRNRQQSKLVIVGLVVLQVLKNPIVFMVGIGIIAHFVLHQTIPPFMADFVDGLANSFGGAALFYLGLSMVGQLRKLTRSTVVTLILLTTAKLWVEIVQALHYNFINCIHETNMGH